MAPAPWRLIGLRATSTWGWRCAQKGVSTKRSNDRELYSEGIFLERLKALGSLRGLVIRACSLRFERRVLSFESWLFDC